ncbi:MAG: hypothetical protein AB2604_10725 [Candidatus Thiodiazotropha taylori]
MALFSDEHIDFWGDVYIANRALLRERGVLFETFMFAPKDILSAVLSGRAIPLSNDQDFYPLLPAQMKVAERLFNQEQEAWERECLEADLTRIRETGNSPARVANGKLIEPLTHHAHPKRRGNRSSFRAAV